MKLDAPRTPDSGMTKSSAELLTLPSLLTISSLLKPPERAATAARGPLPEPTQNWGEVMSMTSTILAIVLAFLFVTLGTTKVLALPVMRERAAEAVFTVGAYRRIGALELA